MSKIKQLELFLFALAPKVPLFLFVIVGSLLEEIVAPIPSPLVMMTAGSLAKAQGQSFLYLALVGLVAAASKTFGNWLFYFFADKAEDILTKKFGKILGFSHQDIENIGKLFNGGKRDDIVLAIIRAIPIMPTTPVSLACGFIKLNKITFLRSSFIGNFIRGMMFGYIGFSGLAIFQSAVQGIDKAENVMNIVLLLLLLAIIIFVYLKRGKINWNKYFQKLDKPKGK